MNTWKQAKNVILPLTPQTKYIELEKAEKKYQIAVDVDKTGCTPENSDLRDRIYNSLWKESKRKKPKVVFAKDHKDMKRLIQESQFTLVSACEDEIPNTYYDAVNALSIPIVLCDKMRFPFENELIDYSGFLFHFSEEFPQEAINLFNKIKPHVSEIVEEMDEARKLYKMSPESGGFVWGLSWSLYMKYLSWLPIKRNKIIDNNIEKHFLYGAM